MDVFVVPEWRKIDRCGVNAVFDIRSGVGDAVFRRQLPNDDLSLSNDYDGVRSHSQRPNPHIRVNDQPRMTGLEVQNRDRTFPPP